MGLVHAETQEPGKPRSGVEHFLRSTARSGIHDGATNVGRRREGRGEGAPRHHPPDEDRAIGACLAKVPPASDDETSATPPAAQRLRDQWWAMVSRLDSEYGDDAAYASCLGASDIEGLGRIGSRDDATLAMQEMTPAASQLPTDADSAWVDSPQWQSLLTAESAWEKRDWLCRSRVYNAHLADVESAVDDFADDHASEIDQTRRGWARVATRAQDLGDDGTYEPITSAQG